MASTNLNRSRFRQQSRKAGKNIQYSDVNCSAAERVDELQTKIGNSTSPKERSVLNSMLCLLHDLMSIHTLPLSVCFEDYLGKLPAEHQPSSKRYNSAMQQFRESLLQQRRGLPVVIISIDEYNPKPYVLLMDKPKTNLSVIEGLNVVIEESQYANHQVLGDLQQHYKNVMELFTSRRARVAAISLLALTFSSTSLRNYLGLNEHLLCQVKKIVLDLITEISDRTEEATEMHMGRLTTLVKRLEEELEIEEAAIDKMPQASNETDYAKFQLRNKEERIRRIARDQQNMVKKAAKREIKKWKENMLSQKRKGQGKYQIDRGAEKVVYKALCEQLAAHDRRKGNPNVGYVDEHKRMHSKDLMMMGNKWLQENGKRLIKSTSTIRSWAAPRNRRYRSAKDHRGQSMWKFSRRSQKKHVEAHINVHYNRAHMKYYTRFCFSQKNGPDFRRFVIRRAIDDKAYLRCGTSEGFSRPLHKPVTLTNQEIVKHLPAYDFPSEAGYVAPGVIQIVEDMDQLDDKYSISSNSIVVTTKPKMVYPSSATNWMNDMYNTRLQFPDQHELTDGKEPPAGTQERRALCQIVFLRDSLNQYSLMNIPNDYMNVTQGGEFLEREQLRHTVLLHRVNNIIREVENVEQYQNHVPKIKALSESLHDFLQSLPLLVTDLTDDVGEAYQTLNTEVNSCIMFLRENNLPRHRPIDIQSSDAGPGVGVSEKMVRIRNAEYFMINDLDMQSRMHYAPRDSKMHSVEKIMSTLNEAAGDGTSIEITRPTLLQKIGEERLLQMSTNELKKFEEDRNVSIAKECANKVAQRYEGVKCRGTLINASPPNYDDHSQLFFDETFMKKCASATTTTSLHALPGCHYYEKVKEFFHEHYIVYDNGMGGIRNACSGDPCQYHIDKGLQFSATGVERVPCPVPDYSDTEKFSYLHPNDIEAGNITAEHNIDVDAIARNEREPDDFCPRTQLKLLIKECGEPRLQVTQYKNDDDSVSYRTKDENHTIEKIKDKLPDFIQRYCGEDLKDEVHDFVENEYLKLVKMAIRKKENMQLREEEDAKGVEDIDWEALVTTSKLDTLKVSQLNLYITDIVGKSGVQVRKAGYLKHDKIMDITAHFYTYMYKGKIHTREISSELNLTL